MKKKKRDKHNPNHQREREPRNTIGATNSTTARKLAGPAAAHLILLSVLKRIQWGMGRFCLAFLAYSGGERL